MHQKESLGVTYSDTQENQLNCARNYEHFTKQSETNNYVKTYHKLVVYNQMLSYVETVPNIFKSWRYYCRMINTFSLQNSDIASPISFCISPGCMFTLPVDLYSPIKRIAVAAADCIAIGSTSSVQAMTCQAGTLTLRLSLVVPPSLLVEELACLGHRQGDLQD